jgi:hypothetical protein
LVSTYVQSSRLPSPPSELTRSFSQVASLCKILKCAKDDDVVTLKAGDEADTLSLTFEAVSECSDLSSFQRVRGEGCEEMRANSWLGSLRLLLLACVETNRIAVRYSICHSCHRLVSSQRSLSSFALS